MTPWTIAAACGALYVINVLAFLTAYALSEQFDHWRNDRRWKRERAAMDAAHDKARGTPRGGKR